MNSSFFITLIALAVVGAIAYFSAVGFRGAGKIKKVPRNLQKYLPDDELETTHLDKTLSIAISISFAACDSFKPILSIIEVDNAIAIGLAIFLPAISGAEP